MIDVSAAIKQFSNGFNSRIAAGSRGQSEVLGTVILIAVVALAAGVTIITGQALVGEVSDAGELEKNENDVSRFASAIERTARTENGFERLRVARAGGFTYKEDVTKVTVNASGASAQTVNLSQLVYSNPGYKSEFIYEGGAVWVQDNGTYLLRHQPPVSFRGNRTLELTFYDVYTGGKSEIASEQVTFENEKQPTVQRRLGNGDNVTITVEGPTYRAWGEIITGRFSDTLNYSVTYDDADEKTTIEIVGENAATIGSTSGGGSNTVFSHEENGGNITANKNFNVTIKPVVQEDEDCNDWTDLSFGIAENGEDAYAICPSSYDEAVGIKGGLYVGTQKKEPWGNTIERGTVETNNNTTVSNIAEDTNVSIFAGGVHGTYRNCESDGTYDTVKDSSPDCRDFTYDEPLRDTVNNKSGDAIILQDGDNIPNKVEVDDGDTGDIGNLLQPYNNSGTVDIGSDQYLVLFELTDSEAMDDHWGLLGLTTPADDYHDVVFLVTIEEYGDGTDQSLNGKDQPPVYVYLTEQEIKVDDSG